MHNSLKLEPSLLSLLGTALLAYDGGELLFVILAC